MKQKMTFQAGVMGIFFPFTLFGVLCLASLLTLSESSLFLCSPVWAAQSGEKENLVEEEPEEIDLGDLDLDESETGEKTKAKNEVNSHPETTETTEVDEAKGTTEVEPDEIDLGDLGDLDDTGEEELQENEKNTVKTESAKKAEPISILTPNQVQKTFKGKDEKTEKDQQPKREKKKAVEKPHIALESVLPANSALIVRVASVREFNSRLEVLTETNFLKLFKSLGKGDIVKQVEPDFPLGVALFPEGISFQWSAFVPVKNYKKFLSFLKVETESFPDEIPEGTVSIVSPTLCVAPYGGYAVFGPNTEMIQKVMKSPKFGDSRAFTPCAVKNPTVSMELTNVLIRFLVERGKIGLEDFSAVFSPEMLDLQKESAQLQLAKQYFEKINQSISWIDANIQSARIDLTVCRNDTLLSTSFAPKSGTPLAEQLRDSYVPLIATRLNGQDFLKVVPTWPASLSGQVDISPLAGEKLQAPFNRIRHVEYSLMTPPEGGRLLEAWCFFLEVNDSNAFVQELLVPRAEEVGEEFGANTLAEIGGKLAEQGAERRLDRQMNRRRPPRRYADPERAMERGSRLGGLLGGVIGKEVAKKEAMKVQDFMGYDIYVSDLIQYSQLKKRIQEQREGTAPPVFPTDGSQPGSLVGMLIQQLVTGDANQNIGNKLMSGLKEETPGDPPLAATRNLIVVLDANHLLIVPGNDAVLYEGIRRWETIRPMFLPPLPPKSPEEVEARKKIPAYIPAYSSLPPRSPEENGTLWHESWETICQTIGLPEKHQIRFAAVFLPEETMRNVEIASRIYGFEIPKKIQDVFPENLPPFLTVYTTAENTGNTFTTIPHELSKAQFDKLIKNLPLLLMK